MRKSELSFALVHSMIISSHMSKRRLRFSKIKASQQRQQSSVLEVKNQGSVPDFALRLTMIDLTRTIIVTILAVTVQLALAAYLNKSDWQIVRKIFGM